MSSDAGRRVEEFRRFNDANPGLSYLDAFIVDVNGNALGKRVAWSEASKVFETGVAFSVCATEARGA